MTLLTSSTGPGCRIDWSVDKILLQEKSWYQTIEIFRSRAWGRMLFLDNQLVITEQDALCFHELVTHIPMFIHPNPADVLICGAAWGGLAREVAKHGAAKRIVQIEPDDAFVDAAIQFWPRSADASAFENGKLLIEDLADTAGQHAESADVLLMDLSSVSSRLPKPKLVSAALGVLKPQGLLMLSVGSPYDNDAKLMQQRTETQAVLRKRFSRVFPLALPMPSKMGGINLCFLCSDWCTPALNAQQQRHMQTLGAELKHYDAATHSAAFILPKMINV